MQINTLDNPGWLVDIDLHDTSMEVIPFSTIQYRIGAESIEDDNNWLLCEVDNKIFKGRKGSEKLNEILAIFLDWVENHC